MKFGAMLKVGAGFLFLILGFIGAFLPIWPTTPFILLAVGCFSATPSIQNRILKVKFVREYYYSYKEKKPIPPITIIASLIFLWGMLIFSMFMANKMMITIILVSVGLAVSAHILWISRLWRKKESVGVCDET